MEEKYTASGPIFEAGPGWGGRLKKWSKKYILGGDCILCRSVRYIFIFGVMVLVALWNKIDLPQQQIAQNTTVITETIQPKDGKTHLARRILYQFLKENPGIKVTAAQKVFIETILKDKITSDSTNQVGGKVEMSYEEVQNAINQANLLTPLQLKKWEGYAQRINF